MYQLQCKNVTCKTRTGRNQSFRHYRTYLAHMALYHPHDKLEDNGEEPINPDPINPDRINCEIEKLKDEIEILKLENIELKKNVIVDVKELRYIKSIIKNNSDEVVKKKSGDDDDDDDK
jgi:hypothetical protein